MKIAVSVPTCTMTSKSRPTCPNRGMSISAAERCPSEETGMNSVKPWITPSTTASIQLTGSHYHRHDQRPQIERATAGALGGDGDLRAQPLRVAALPRRGPGENG